jgi:hypothetical protein
VKRLVRPVGAPFAYFSGAHWFLGHRLTELADWSVVLGRKS